jgi:uncharacterized protein (DUF2345 family)
MRIVHEGRGGYIELDGERYVIEHVEAGQFCIHASNGSRTSKRQEQLEQLRQLARDEPERWTLQERTRQRDD